MGRFGSVLVEAGTGRMKSFALRFLLELNHFHVKVEESTRWEDLDPCWLKLELGERNLLP